MTVHAGIYYNTVAYTGHTFFFLFPNVLFMYVHVLKDYKSIKIIQYIMTFKKYLLLKL